MKNKSLKSVLKFWQEIVLAVPIGFFLIEMTKYVMRSQTMDVWIILLAIWLLPLLVCLVVQFFRKSEALAVTLSVLLGLSSVIVIILALVGIFYSPTYMAQHIPMLIIGVVCVIAAITMSRKYHSDIIEGTLVKQ
jgi:FtsH-binding integral membrane protein